MKKLLLIIGLAIASVTLNAQILVTNITANGTYRLLSSGANVKSVKVWSTSPTTLQFYDANVMTAPYYGTNYVTAQYTSRVTSPTTNVTEYVGYGGYTNYYTNIGVSTIGIVSMASTNQLQKMFVVSIPASTWYEADLDVILNNGLVVYALPATNVSLTITYSGK